MRPHPVTTLPAICIGLLLPEVLLPQGPPGGKPPGGGPPSATIRVDCTDPDPANHDSIAAALNNRARDLTIEISGICEEDIVVERDNVTFRGSDPLVDGLRGQDPLPVPGDATVRLEQTRNVRIENLQVTGGRRNGLTAAFSTGTEVVNCRVVDNAINGLVAGTGNLEVTDTYFAGNGASAIVGVEAGRLTANRVTVASSAYSALLAFRGAFIDVSESVLSAPNGATAFYGGAYINLHDTSVVAEWFGLYAYEAAVAVVGGSIDGAIGAASRGLIQLTDTDQVANSLGLNVLDMSSQLFASGGSRLTGDLHATGFSSIGLDQGSTVVGDLVCQSGSDAFCVDPVNQVTGLSDCGQCPKP